MYTKYKKDKVDSIIVLVMLIATMLISYRFSEVIIDNINNNTVVISQYELDEQKEIGMGVYLPNAFSSNAKGILDFESKIEHKVEYILMFQAWGNSHNIFPKDNMSTIRSLELTPIVTWEPWARDFVSPTRAQDDYSLESIVNGKHDMYIRNWAKAAKEADYPFIIRFGHEMSTTPGRVLWYPWQGRPAQYTAAYKHIVGIFRDTGADKVKFMWNPIGYEKVTRVNEYYPGDDYVDYLGLTVVNFGEVEGKKGEDYNWVGCRDKFQEQYQWVTDIDRPIIITELMTSDYYGNIDTNKGLWYSECFEEFKNYPSIESIIIYQDKRETRWSKEVIDWRIDSDQESLLSFKAGIAELFR